MKIKLLVTVLIHLLIQANANEYCDVCADHTLCVYNETSLGKSCGDSEAGGVSEDEKKFILDTHNWFRRIVAKGLENRGLNGSQLSASNMMKVYWDDELAESAQRWADQCQFQHDNCRNSKRFNVGQNIYWNWRFPIIKTVNWTSALHSWFDEIDQFNPEDVISYEFNPNTGHYSQLVWHDSYLIGCGQRSYGPNKIYICNYGPTGNWLQESLYDAGEPCSRCPSGTFCEDGLCASAEHDATNITDTLIPPKESSYSIYKDYTEATTDDPEVTELPIHLNLINDLDIPDDEDIRNEIEDLKMRIRKLVDKIAQKNAAKQL